MSTIYNLTFANNLSAYYIQSANGLLQNDTGDILYISSTTQPMSGSVTVNANGSFTYIPNDYHVDIIEDSFIYTARDAFGQTASATVYVCIDATLKEFTFNQTDPTVINIGTSQFNDISADVYDITNLNPVCFLGDCNLELVNAENNQSFVWLPGQLGVNPDIYYEKAVPIVYKNTYTNFNDGLSGKAVYLITQPGYAFNPIHPDWGSAETYIPDYLPIVKDNAPGYSAATNIPYFNIGTNSWELCAASDVGFPAGVPAGTREISAWEFVLNFETQYSAMSRSTVLPGIKYSAWFPSRNSNVVTFLDNRVENSPTTPTHVLTGAVPGDTYNTTFAIRNNIPRFGEDAAVKYQVYTKPGNGTIIASYPNLSGAYANYAEHYWSYLETSGERSHGGRFIAQYANDVWFNVQFDGRLIKIPSSVYQPGMETTITSTGTAGYPLSSIPGYAALTSPRSDRPYSFYGGEISDTGDIFAVWSCWATYASNPTCLLARKIAVINPTTNKLLVINSDIGRTADPASNDIPDAYFASASATYTTDLSSKVYYGAGFHDYYYDTGGQGPGLVINDTYLAGIDSLYGVSKGTFNNKEYMFVTTFIFGAVSRNGPLIILDPALIKQYMDEEGPFVSDKTIAEIQAWNPAAIKLITADIHSQYNSIKVLGPIGPDWSTKIGAPMRAAALIDGKILCAGGNGVSYSFDKSIEEIFDTGTRTLTTDTQCIISPISATPYYSTSGYVKTGVAGIKDDLGQSQGIVLAYNNSSKNIAYIDITTGNNYANYNPLATSTTYTYTNFTGYSEAYEELDNGYAYMTFKPLRGNKPVKWLKFDIDVVQTSGDAGAPINGTTMPMSASVYHVSGMSETLLDRISIFNEGSAKLQATLNPSIVASSIDIKIELDRVVELAELAPPESLKINKIRVHYF